MTPASNPARVLQLLARDVRAKTLQLLQASRPNELLWAPPGTSNHLLWHAGHALWVQDALCVQVLTGRSELPPGWGGTFGMGSRPAQHRGPWPEPREVRRRLEDQLPRLLGLIGAVAGEALDRLPPFPHRGDPRTLGESIVHGLHDEANHQGEMYLLLKMRRLGLDSRT
jgi:hypothetical protein